MIRKALMTARTESCAKAKERNEFKIFWSSAQALNNSRKQIVKTLDDKNTRLEFKILQIKRLTVTNMLRIRLMWVPEPN